MSLRKKGFLPLVDLRHRVRNYKQIFCASITLENIEEWSQATVSEF
jgi:hypothetical protein